MMNLATKLNSKGMNVDETILVQFVMLHLLPEFGPFVVISELYMITLKISGTFKKPKQCGHLQFNV